MVHWHLVDIQLPMYKKEKTEVIDKPFSIRADTLIFYERSTQRFHIGYYDGELFISYIDNGEIIGKSKLLFDEEEDVLKEDVPVKEIDYNIIKKSKKISGLTRREAKIVLLLSKYLDKIYENKKNDEIKYMYFECFNKVEEDNEKARDGV